MAAAPSCSDETRAEALCQYGERPHMVLPNKYATHRLVNRSRAYSIHLLVLASRNLLIGQACYAPTRLRIEPF